MRTNYRYELLQKHSNEVSLTTRRLLKHEVKQVRNAFDFLDQHFGYLERQPKSHVRNVKMMLTARFINHLLSALQLIERGLVLDAFNCSRSALETTAFYWLVCNDSSSATLYDQEKSPPPVEIRKRLEKQGVDVRAIRDLYSTESTISHVGNETDQLQLRWEKGSKGSILVGGDVQPDLQRQMLAGLVISVFRFVKFEDEYIVPDLDDPATWGFKGET